MTQIMKKCWGERKDELRKILAERTGLNCCDYETLVKLVFETVYNGYVNDAYIVDLEKITTIDNGDYQGILLFVIPFHTYQPRAHEYIMTHIDYGSCSGCDALQAAQAWFDDDSKLTEQQIIDFMAICKDIVSNAIKPYNYGWREDQGWLPAEE